MFNRDLLPNPQAYYGQQFTLKGNKAKHLVPCCFHHDKTASLSLDLTTGRFNCFGCGASGGDIVDFHQLKTGLSFVEAAKDLGAWTDTTQDTPDQLATRKAKIEQANKEYKARQAQAAKDEISQAQAFIPLVANILKQCTKPMLEPPYCVAKGINGHNLTSITATDIQRFTLPKDDNQASKPITVCYGFEGLLTVAILETLDGEPVALQAFDGVANNKGKYARWIIGKPVLMGAYYRIGDFSNPSVVLITEGIADAISCYEATGYPCLAAISKGQLAHAAQAVKSKYPHSLIVMCGDNDADGGGEIEVNKAAHAVNGLAVIPKGLDGVKDFNDLHQQHGLEAVKTMINEAIEKKKAAPSLVLESAASRLASESINQVANGGDTLKKQSFAYGLGRFEVSLKGVFYRDDDDKPHFICSPLWVKAKTRTGQGEAWGRLLEWLDDDGNLHQWAMPLELLEGDCTEVRKELAHKGVSIEPSKTGRDRLAIYLKKSPVEDRALCVERLGWYDDVYILPKQVIGTSKEIIVFQNPHGIENPFMQSGTVEQWRDNVSRFAIGNTRLLLALSFAFGACLFELSHAESGGIHFLGASSIGKSTFLDAACSVWGKPKHYKKEWRNTANAIEGLCTLHNNGLLVLDEINQADIKTIGQTIYMIVNGQSKGRMTKNGNNRPVIRWNTPFLSGGEQTLEAILTESGQTINAGQAVRLANVRALVGKHGAFEQLHGLESGDTLSKLIKANANKHYGTVGITWLEYIAANKDSISQELDTRIKAWLQANVPQGASGQVLRVASRFALIGIAGELATKQGLTGWPTGEANNAAKVCFEDWLLSFGGISNHEDRAILAHVKAFFEAHGSSRFEALEQMSGDKVEKVINRVGYWRQDNTGKYYLVFQEAFKNEICKGFDVKHVIRVLSSEDVLIKGKDGKSTTPTRTPESPTTTRMYLINADMLFSGCNKGNRCNNDDLKEVFYVTPTKTHGVTGVTNFQELNNNNHTELDSVTPVTPLHTFKSERCNKENPNKINLVTPVTPVTPQKHDILKNSQNIGLCFDESVIGEV